MSDNKWIADFCTAQNKAIIGSIFAVILVFILITVPLSFSYIEWNEYALKKSTVSNKVDYDTVYDTGRYFWGLGYGPTTFQKTVTTVQFSDDTALKIFTEGGLEIDIDCSFQYAVVRDEIPILYQKYSGSYPQQIVSIARSILKNIAPNYTAEDYYQNRDTVRAAMFNTLQEGLRLEININVVYFQLDSVTLPPLLVNKLLNIAIQNQSNIREQYVQQAALIRKETALLAQSMLSNATLILGEANAEANFLQLSADAEAFTLVQEAKKIGYQQLFQGLNLTTPDLQLAYIYATTLQNVTNINLLVGVNSVIVNT